MRSRGPVQVGDHWEHTATFKNDKAMMRWIESAQRAGWSLKTHSVGGIGVGRLKDFVATMEYRPVQPRTEEEFRAWAVRQIMTLTGEVARLNSEVEALRSPANVLNIMPGPGTVIAGRTWPNSLPGAMSG